MAWDSSPLPGPRFTVRIKILASGLATWRAVSSTTFMAGLWESRPSLGLRTSPSSASSRADNCLDFKLLGRGQAQLIRAARLDQIVGGAGLNGIHGGINRRVGGDDHHTHPGRLHPHLGDKISRPLSSPRRKSRKHRSNTWRCNTTCRLAQRCWPLRRCSLRLRGNNGRYAGWRTRHLPAEFGLDAQWLIPFSYAPLRIILVSPGKIGQVAWFILIDSCHGRVFISPASVIFA